MGRYGVFGLRNAEIITAAVCLFACIGSASIEYVWKAKPCELCLITRYSHLAIACLAITSIVLGDSVKVGFFKVGFLRKAIIVALGAAMCFAAYHIGVENHWWHGPAKCTTDLLPTLDGIPGDESIVRCDVVNFAIFGLSLTLYNFAMLAGLFWLFSISLAVSPYILISRHKQGD
jgi:disulfide bond formation protein DsbB